MFFGIIVIVVGAALLLQNLGILSGDLWSILWPLIVIAIGFGIMSRRHGHCGWWCWHCNKENCEKCRAHKDSMRDGEKADHMH